MILTKKSTMTTLTTAWQTTSILLVGAKTTIKITVITNKGNCININEGNSNSKNNNNSKENNINNSNINSKININNTNNNSKENNINSNGGENITTNKQQQARKTAFIIANSMVKKVDGYLLTSFVNHKYIVKVRPFLSAKTIGMLNYIKPTQRDFNPDVYLLHVGKMTYHPANLLSKYLWIF